MWCRSDARLRHACCLFIFYKPFMWCRSDARLRHGYSCIFLSRSHSDTRLALSILLWDFGRTTARLLFCFPCIIISMSDCTCCSHTSCLHLLYLMFELSCEYFHSTHPRTACSYYLCMRATQTFVADVVIIIISEHDCPLLYYTRVLNVCEYIQTYSLACPWLLSWPDSLLGDKHRDDGPGTCAATIAAMRR